MNDYELKISQAQGLPDGWTWREWDDGSGSLRSPNGKKYMEYDAQTKEFRYKGEQWQFFDGYPRGTVSLIDVKDQAESHIKNMLARENTIPEHPREQPKTATNRDAR